jgi:hypothetical protein
VTACNRDNGVGTKSKRRACGGAFEQRGILMIAHDSIGGGSCEPVGRAT